MLGDDAALVAQPDDVGENRSIQSSRESPGHVASVVTRRNQHCVGRALSLDESGERRGHGHSGKRTLEVAHVIEGRRAVVTGLGGEGSAASPSNAHHVVAQCARLAQQLQ